MCQDPGTFLREAERGRAAIADPLTGALPGPNDHSDLAFETHGKHSLQQVFKDASMVPPFASQPGRPDYLPIASFILDTPARARVAGHTVGKVVRHARDRYARARPRSRTGRVGADDKTDR